MQEGEQVEDPKEAERLAAQEEERRAAAEREFKMIIKTVRFLLWHLLLSYLP